ncbi:MAG: 2'-5' RNA ligase family protein [Clostridia bacterium]|nr:2'-5' RNA ligase family protein [Clostridia bacterium]
MRYCIGFLCDDNTNQFREQYYKKVKETHTNIKPLGHLPAHITVKSPFDFEDEELLIKKIEELAKEIECFSVAYRKIERIETEIYEILWLDVIETGFLRNFHNKLLKIFPSSETSYDGDGFHFHTTLVIGNDLSDDLSSISMTTEINALILMATDEDHIEDYKVLKAFRLKEKESWH